MVEDGGGIARNGEDPDLMIALVNRSGRVIARYPGDGDLLSVESTNSTVEFQDINAGTYTVYAVANAQGLEAATRSAFASATTSSEIEDVLVLPSDGSASFLGGRMPLSAKGSVTVNAGGNGQVNLDLLRVFARVSLSFFKVPAPTTSPSPSAVVRLSRAISWLSAPIWRTVSSSIPSVRTGVN